MMILQVLEIILQRSKKAIERALTPFVRRICKRRKSSESGLQVVFKDDCRTINRYNVKSMGETFVLQNVPETISAWLAAGIVTSGKLVLSMYKEMDDDIKKETERKAKKRLQQRALHAEQQLEEVEPALKTLAQQFSELQERFQIFEKKQIYVDISKGPSMTMRRIQPLDTAWKRHLMLMNGADDQILC